MMLQATNLPNETERKNILRERNSLKIAALNKKIEEVEKSLPKDTLRILEQTKQRGSSTWLSVLPSQEHGFNLTKREFRDALSLRYNLPIKGLPSHCPCYTCNELQTWWFHNNET